MSTPTIERKLGWRASKGRNPENKSGFHVTGHRILLEPEGGERTTEGGIVIPDSAAEKAQAHNVWATVLEIGTECWSDKNTDYAEVGDRVLVGKFAGKFETSPVDGKSYRFLNDLDVIAVSTEGEL